MPNFIFASSTWSFSLHHDTGGEGGQAAVTTEARSSPGREASRERLGEGGSADRQPTALDPFAYCGPWSKGGVEAIRQRRPLPASPSGFAQGEELLHPLGDEVGQGLG